MSIRTGSLNVRTLLACAAVSAGLHFGFTSIARAESLAPASQAPSPVKLAPIVFAPLTVLASPAQASVLLGASYAPRGPGLVRWCAQGRGVIESGVRDPRTGRVLPVRLRCGL